MALNSEQVLDLLLKQSLLGMVFSSKELEQFLIQFPPRKAASGDCLAQEGNLAAHLLVSVDSDFRLTSKSQSGENTAHGSVKPGRAVNLYSVLRGLPFQYSAIATSNCQYLAIPWASLEPFIARVSGLKEYLALVTENSTVRQMAKDLEEIGCSKQFAIRVLGSIKSIQFAPQTWILQQGEVPTFAFCVQEGAVHAFQKSKNENLISLWQVPLRQWQFWKECRVKTASPYCFRSLTSVQLFSIDAAIIRAVRAEFPTDSIKLDDLLSSLKVRPNPEITEAEQEIESFKDLFPKQVLGKMKFTLRYPFVQQKDQMDCGPACLSMISKCYGNPISVQFWRERVQTSHEGTTLFDLARGAEKNGFICHSIAIEDLEQVDADLLPAIVLRKHHYCVLYKITSKHVILGDPGLGIRRVSHEEFYDGFENALLLLKPEDSFFKIHSTKTRYSHYFTLFHGYKREFLLALICSFILVVFSLFPPVLLQIILDEVLAKKDVRLLGTILAAGAVVLICQGILTWIRAYYVAFISAKIDFVAASAFLRKVFSLPYSFFATRHSGDFTRRLAELERVREFLTNYLMKTVLDIVTLGVYGAMLFYYSPTVAGMTFIAAPMLVGLCMLFSRKLKGSYLEMFNQRTEQDGLFLDLIKGAGLIKSLNAEVAARWRFEERLAGATKSLYEFSKTSASLTAVVSVHNAVSRFGLLGFATYLAIQGKLSPGQVLALAMIVNNIFDPFLSLSNSWAAFQELKISVERLNDVFLTQSEHSSQRGARTSGVRKSSLRGEIEFQDVWFRYGGDSSAWVLKGVSFKVEPGQNVAIVGPSGSGKTTIAQLLSGLYEPTKGQILIDGQDYRSYDPSWLKSQIGYLFQESNLFYGTVMENIAFASPEIDEQRAIASAKLAGAHDFISEKSTGYGYYITHGGLGLSGGQKQRIAIARMLYNNPSVFVLDEATSALDGATERLLVDQLKETTAGKTILSIAHRYSTVLMSDFALIMKEGKLHSFGTHEELQRSNSLYIELFGLQKKAARKTA